MSMWETPAEPAGGDDMPRATPATNSDSFGALGLDRPVLEQMATFERTILRNPIVEQVLTRAGVLHLPAWYLTAGCLFQTVWNVACGFEPTRGIHDYDLFYFDATDLSWDAEDGVIRRSRSRRASPHLFRISLSIKETSQARRRRPACTR